ncbi:uncharacterized protein N7482_009106 [Penicillium canariense]|uniref:ADP-ribosylhydrolase ARH3 n=1 Tax=Penicillium canariense TaxID=189055 RepID=A0A9W9HM37_9EURO|nr:uncharacterized protein N7482_009106 [Penicillium canariense]KAJ5152628.1 hypothetical protein N7482_009106 [Penicillium canariense]
MIEPTVESRALGAIWGTCVADALGGPVQFSPPGTFEPITELEFYFLEWLGHGRFSTTDEPWDIGISTHQALKTWEADGVEELELTQQKVNRKLNREDASGNGSLMRISPVGVALWKDCDLAKKVAREQSKVTHPAWACQEACQAYTELVCLAMGGISLDPISRQSETDFTLGQTKGQLCEAIARFNFTHPALVARFSRYASLEDWTAKTHHDIKSSGWVVDTLEAALWGFFRYESWEEGALAVVNLGGDSDTAGAVYGGLAGVFYGYDSIPSRWRGGMQSQDMIGDVARKFAGIVPSN